MVLYKTYSQAIDVDVLTHSHIVRFALNYLWSEICLNH